MLLNRGGVLAHPLLLARGEFADRRGKPLIADEVRGAHQSRHESSRHLVLTLRSRLESRELVFDAVLDPLVVAGLEMQAVIIAAGAPVAAKQRILAEEEYGDGDRVRTR